MSHARFRPLRGVLLVGLALASVVGLRAQLTWSGTGGTGNIYDSANWGGSAFLGNGTQSVFFGNSPNGNVQVFSASVTNVTFGSPRPVYTLSSGGSEVLTIGGWVGTDAHANAVFIAPTVTVSLAAGTHEFYSDGASSQLNIQGAVIGLGKIEKWDAGALTLSGTNTYAGGTTVRAGNFNLIAGSISHGSAPTLVGVQSGDVASLSISGGADVINDYSYIAVNGGSSGHVTVSGAGSTWGHSTLLGVGQGGSGSLIVESGGAVTSSIGEIGYVAGATGNVLIEDSGSAWNLTSYLGIGNSGAGTLELRNGGAVNAGGGAGTIILGDTASGNGTLFIQGTDNRLNAATVSGGLGTASVHLDTGGTYYLTKDATAGGSAVALTGNLKLYNDSGTNTLLGNHTYLNGTEVRGGTLEINGGSIAHATAALEVAPQASDFATLRIANGGDVTSLSASLAAGGSASAGFAYVSGAGSTWTNAGLLQVGVLGSGGLWIENGGAVASSGGSIATQLGSVGAVTVDGPSSAWQNSPGSVFVGEGGTGTLALTNGGTLTSLNGLIGFGAASVGTVLVDGAASSWTTTGSIDVGGAGMGAVILKNGGKLTVLGGANAVTLGANGGVGSLMIGDSSAGGILDTAQIRTTTGLGTLTFNTNATAASPYYLTRNGNAGGSPVLISGPTQVLHNAGFTTLNSAHTYTGNTILSGGTLLVGHDSALGTSTVTLNGGTLALGSGISFTNTLNASVTGGTLAGTGSFANPLTLGSGFKLAPGFSTGTLHFSSGLTLNDGLVSEFEIQGAAGTPGLNWDLIDVTGTLNLAPLGPNGYTLKLISLALNNAPGAVAGLSGPTSWTIMTAGSVTGFQATDFAIDQSQFVGGGIFNVTADATSVVLHFTPVPEPGVYALMGVGLGTAWLLRRRRAGR